MTGELARIRAGMSGSEFNLYQEDTDDSQSIWLFVGDTSKWDDPLIEYVLAGKKAGAWMKYWIPQVHIDIDTKLSQQELYSKIESAYAGTIVKPFSPLTVAGIPYIVGVWVAIADGVNIYLNLGTNERNTKFHRQHLLKEVTDSI